MVIKEIILALSSCLSLLEALDLCSMLIWMIHSDSLNFWFPVG